MPGMRIRAARGMMMPTWRSRIDVVVHAVQIRSHNRIEEGWQINVARAAYVPDSGRGAVRRLHCAAIRAG